MQSDDNRKVSTKLTLQKYQVLKDIAAERGLPVEDVVNIAVSEYVDAQGLVPPTATEIIQKLKPLKPKFEREEVIHLSLFGSVARGEARRGSDIDLVAEFKNGWGAGLFRLGRLDELVENAIGEGFKIDLVPYHFLPPPIQEAANSHAIKIF